MENICFVLVDSWDKEIPIELHQRLLEKISSYDYIIVGTKSSRLARHKFSSAKECYQFLAQQKQGKDLLIIDAYASKLSILDTKDCHQYMLDGQYDVCLTENIPEALVPMIISRDFLQDFAYFIDEETSLQSTLKNIIDWEYKGIDVGLFLSRSFAILRRVDFLPVNEGATKALQDVKEDPNLDNLEDFITNHPILLRNVPQFVAIELASETDQFAVSALNTPPMSPDVFQKIIDDLEQLSPDCLVSLGVWGDPFLNPDFEKIFDYISTTNHRVYVEIRGLSLNKEYAQKVLLRPNTELIIDVSFSTEAAYQQYKNTGHSLEEVQQFMASLPNQEHVWARLTRTPQSEEHIKNFLQLFPHNTIMKADSFGSLENQVVDLSPIERHSCFALRRELTILSDGSVLLCRQSKNILANIKEESLPNIWAKNQEAFLNQEKGQFNTCSLCERCDDWWIWN